MKVKVYRNLKHGRKARPLYSIMDLSTGKVIDRRHRVLLTDATFKVNEAGRQRVIKEGRKNVHAFVIGTLVDSKGAFGIDENGKDLSVRVHYSPYESGQFIARGVPTYPLKSAMGVLLNENGMTATYTERLED